MACNLSSNDGDYGPDPSRMRLAHCEPGSRFVLAASPVESLPSLQQLYSLLLRCPAAAACLTHRTQSGRGRVHGLSSSALSRHGSDAVPADASIPVLQSLLQQFIGGPDLHEDYVWQVLPDVTTDRWRYKGTAMKRGHHADVWVLRLEPNEGYGTYHSNYTLYVTKVTTGNTRICVLAAEQHHLRHARPILEHVDGCQRF